VGIADRAKKILATTSDQLVLNGFGDEPASIPFEPVNPLHQLGGQGDRDAFSDTHVR
jgi:hypothetical protein